MNAGLPEGRAGVLDRILTSKQREVAELRKEPLGPPRRSPGGEVARALARSPGEPLRLIAEVKRRSPSAGELSQVLSPPERALSYARAGASMISVLTDGPFFGGSFDHLAACRDALDEALGPARPRLLCKEFILDPIQLDRAADAGADAALLIARLVDAPVLAMLVREARARGMEPLVEVVDEVELGAALSAGALVIGVNARDLDTLKMDPARAAHVLVAIDGEKIAVHLSGLATPEDIREVAARAAPSRRVDAALIGEALMRKEDPTDLLSAMARAACVPSDCGS